MTTNRHEVEVDTQLAEIWSRTNAAHSKLASVKLELGYQVGTVYYATKTRREVRESLDELLVLAAEKLAAGEVKPYDVARLEAKVAQVTEIRETLAALRAEREPLEAEYDETRWSRFFLVTSSAGGHIHSSMSCSTCHPTTSFGWLPELSGLTEKDAVDAHGPLLCSVCYPSAPVEWTVGATKEEDPDTCPGSGTTDHDSSGVSYYQKRARCNHCHQVVSVTSAYNLRKHKKA